MRVIVQRSKHASVKVNNEVVGEIDKGMVLLVGFTHTDTFDVVDQMVNKVLNLRIFDDSNGVMNLPINKDTDAILSISQFTLYADSKKGNRPSYIEALNGDEAVKLYNYFNEQLKKYIHVETGRFKTEMLVSLENDGPITIMLEK